MSRFEQWETIIPSDPGTKYPSYLIISIRSFSYRLQNLSTKGRAHSLPKHWIDSHYKRSLSDILSKL